MVQTARRTIDTSQLRLNKVVDAPICRWCEFHRCRRGEDVALSQLHLLIDSLRAALS